MWQLFKPLTERQHLEKELKDAQNHRLALKDALDKIYGMLYENDVVIGDITNELENLK